MKGRASSLVWWASVVATIVLLLAPTRFKAAPGGAEYRLIRTIHVGGEGSWDQFTLDPGAKRIYIPRATHIMVFDEVTGKTIGDIPNLEGLHSVQVAPEFNRGFATTNTQNPPASTIT